MVEFQAIDKVFNPSQIGRNTNFTEVVTARKVDLFGRFVLQIGREAVATGPAEVTDLVSGAEISPGGRTIFALSSRSGKGDSNILVSVKDFPQPVHLARVGGRGSHGTRYCPIEELHPARTGSGLDRYRPAGRSAFAHLTGQGVRGFLNVNIMGLPEELKASIEKTILESEKDMF
jgi:hypothetical protein